MDTEPESPPCEHPKFASGPHCLNKGCRNNAANSGGKFGDGGVMVEPTPTAAPAAPVTEKINRDYCKRVTTAYLDAVDAKRERQAASE